MDDAGEAVNGGGVVLVVRLWVEATRVDAFERFERDAARIVERHGGRVERVIRRADDAAADEPFEVHLVRFPDEGALAAWREDPFTKALATERDAVIVRTSVFRGEERPSYHEPPEQG